MTDTIFDVVCAGAGYFARLHHAAWAALPGARLVAIADPDEARAAEAAARHGARAHGSLDAALDAHVPAIVDIAAPPDAHGALIERATRGPRPPLVVCQKPLCGGLEGARAAVSLCAERGATLVVHENFRFQPWYREIGRQMEAGAIGTPLQATFRLRPGDGQGPDAYLDRQPYFQRMRRFLVHETGVHFIDTFRFLLGEPDWVWADLRRLNPAIAGEDAGLVTLGFGDGRRALLDANRLVDHPARDRRRTMGEALVEGTAGTLALDGDGALGLRRHGENAWRPVALGKTPPTFGGGCVDALQAHVLDHLAHGSALENEGAAYLRNMEIVEAAYRSAREGARVALGREATRGTRRLAPGRRRPT